MAANYYYLRHRGVPRLRAMWIALRHAWYFFRVRRVHRERDRLRRRQAESRSQEMTSSAEDDLEQAMRQVGDMRIWRKGESSRF